MAATRISHLLLAAIATAGFACPAAGQAGLEAAGGTTSLVATDFSALTIEAAETSLTLLLAGGVFGLPRTTESSFRLKLSAEEGKRDLFSEGRWVPGLELEQRFVGVRNHADVTGGHSAAFVSLGYEVKSNSLARTADGSVIETYERIGHTPTAGLGFNWAPNDTGFLLGFSATAGHGFTVPVARRTSQVCTQQAAGTSEDGAPSVVSKCQNRYLGAVHDAWTGEFRVDLRSRNWVVPIGGGAEEARALQTKIDLGLGLSGADFRTRQDSIAARESRLADALRPLELVTRSKTDALARARDSRVPTEIAAAEAALRQAQADERPLRDSLQEVRDLRDKLFKAEELTSNAPQVSLLASASTAVSDGSKPIHSVAVGPMLHPPLTPLKVIAGVLFELDDLTNATGEAPEWADRFAVRLYIGVPF